MFFRMALAEAQALAIRKLLSKSAYDGTVTPGPPLPKSHPPPGLVAKLHLECASLFSSARSLVKTASGPKAKFKPSFGKSKGTDDDANEGSVEEVSPDLKRYLADEAALHSALASRWLGVDCGEDGGLDWAGQAVGYLQWAKKELEELKDGTKSGISLPGINNENERKARERRKATVAKELGAVTIFLKHYRNMNDTVRVSASSSGPCSRSHSFNSTNDRLRSNPSYLRLNYKLSFQRGKWLFRPDRMSFLLQLSVLDRRATSRISRGDVQLSRGRSRRTTMITTQQQRP